MFLDEIGNLPPEVQQMLLRALEAKRYRPTGGSKVFGSNPKSFELLETYLAAANFGSNRKAFG